MKLEGKKALVTGAARGIGKGCALELARAGADLAINDFGRTGLLEETAAEIRALGCDVPLVEGDAFDRPTCEQIVARAIEALGRIDILVSNPALSRRDPFLEYDPENWDRVLRGALSGGFHMSQFVARHMVERGEGGKIVFISSIHARIPFARSVAYNAAKYGLNGMAFTIATELLPHRINVNVIEPGWINTPGEHESFGTAAIAEAGPKLPWGRLGQPSDIGRAAVFLCSEDADYITGASLVVDGGFWLQNAHE
ncbi:MAG: SDR family oxidoreductase [Armatimonadetes bacterium]|nr:SDR family oxidoreductase [Armatimonadota bacterium]MBM3947033.1 SDR family oxidoreductase [SAR202 cluster bacterium]